MVAAMKRAFHLATAALALSTACAGIGQKASGDSGGTGDGAIDARPDTNQPMDASDGGDRA